MKSIKNLTRTFLKIHLPGGKTLRLGPGNTGQIAEAADEHPSVKKLIDEGKIQVVGDGTNHPTGTNLAGGPSATSGSVAPRSKGRSSGDR